VQRTTVLTTLIAVLAVYAASLIGYSLLDQSPAPFQFEESSVTGETTVIFRPREINANENRLTVDVLVHPGPDLQSAEPEEQKQFTVRLSSWTESGDLIYVHDDMTGNEETTSLIAIGDPDNWPFDSYDTDVIGVQAFVGSGDAQELVPARIVVAGNVNGWRIDDQMSTIDSGTTALQTVRITMERTRGALAFDVGLVLVLLALPATALFVAIEMLLGRRKFQPPFITWFAAMLFAVVPLRNILPGAPPPGALIDMAVVLWVLIALAGAMVMFVAAWWRQTKAEGKPEIGSKR